jgi:hypothetical protein
MSTQQFISIPEPCHVGWENMHASEKGKFCSSCRKEVRDFSHSSVEDIRAAYLENMGELCGHVPVRILQEQYFERQLKSSHFSHLKKLFIAAVFCFGSSLFTIDAAKASTFYKLKLSFLQLAANDTVKVSGEVRDKQTRELLPFVNVTAVYKDSVVAGAVTDIDGKYILKIPSEYTSVDVTVKYIGYVTRTMKSISIAPHKQIVVDFDMEALETIMDGMIIMEEPPLIDQNPGPTGKTVKRERYKKMPK